MRPQAHWTVCALLGVIVSGNAEEAAKGKASHAPGKKLREINQSITEAGMASSGLFGTTDYLHPLPSSPASGAILSGRAAQGAPLGTSSGGSTGPSTQMATEEPTQEPGSSTGSAASERTPKKSIAQDIAPVGKSVVTDKNVIEEPKPAIEFAFDAGYQTRYYLLGSNVILAAGNKIPQEISDFAAKNAGVANPDKEVTAEDTAMYYGGVSAKWNGFSAGVRYIRGTQTIQSQFSALSTIVPTFTSNPANNPTGTTFGTDYSPVFKKYEEFVFDVNYSANLLPGGLLSGTVGYQPIVYPEATFFNTDRQDRMYATLGNSSFAFARPSMTYNHISQADPLTSGTLLPGARLFNYDIMTIQMDGEIPLVTLGEVDVHGAYYAQMGLNSTTDFAKDYYQLGVSLPIYYRNFVMTPHWNYNHRYDTSSFISSGVTDNEQFLGINCRVNF